MIAAISDDLYECLQYLKHVLHIVCQNCLFYLFGQCLCVQPFEPRVHVSICIRTGFTAVKLQLRYRCVLSAKLLTGFFHMRDMRRSFCIERPLLHVPVCHLRTDSKRSTAVGSISDIDVFLLFLCLFLSCQKQTCVCKKRKLTFFDNAVKYLLLIEQKDTVVLIICNIIIHISFFRKIPIGINV